MALTIGETIDKLHGSLRQYIEAAYHIGHPALIEQRRRLLNIPGVIHQRPYLESTPRYRSQRDFADLGLDSEVLAFFQELSASDNSNSQLIYDPPYDHQAAAIVGSLVDRKSLLVMTGTGSGKTECFLLPILGKLAAEAIHKSQSFGTSAVRALILYPMNALVNDQLGRLRLLFGDDRVVDQFISWSGRPARFARYTSRTLYPGVRDAKKDQRRLKALEDFYINQLMAAASPLSEQQVRAAALVDELHHRGKWPAKPDIQAWYGKKGSRWKDSQGEFQRCVTLPRDAELLTRHEVHVAPPDILITNYSMLEYMLMRPLERPIFDQTQAWLDQNPDETFLLVIDEAHLYRGAGGAEVALLLRRLRTRLNIPPERLQVICTSASFRDKDYYAIQFAAQLTGKSVKDFAEPIQGTLALRDPASTGTLEDAKQLEAINLDGFYQVEAPSERLVFVEQFIRSRGVSPSDAPVEAALYSALENYPPLCLLINRTMQQACPIDELGADLFPGVEAEIADKAVTTLVALGSMARPEPNQPGLLPCRVHAFYRGLAGLWVCMDPNCTELPVELRGKGPAGLLYSQPRDACGCGARVMELFTCRNCGTAYARGYTDDLTSPRFLWAEAGGAFRSYAGFVDELEPLDLLLEEPISPVDPVSYDLITGQLDPVEPGSRNRILYISQDRFQTPDSTGYTSDVQPGQFRPCAVCNGRAGYNRSSVQDHQTKGDQPFRALITEQIQVQPPGAVARTPFAPLQGRKVLVFSDSRQTAARLAPNIQTYSMQDVMRPLIVSGFAQLQRSPAMAAQLSLEDAYLAVLVSAVVLGIRLRPSLRADESFTEAQEVKRAVEQGALNSDSELLQIARRVSQSNPPHSLLRAIVNTIIDKFYGLESLALASVIESPARTEDILSLPDIPGLAMTDEQKLALARIWLRAWHNTGFWLRGMPPEWYGDIFNSHSGSFKAINKFFPDKGTKSAFKKTWLPGLLRIFTETVGHKQYRLRGGDLSLWVGGEWAYCSRCRMTQRPFPGLTKCINCGENNVSIINPDTDRVFVARKGYYRTSTVEALKDGGRQPMALIAAEHTAQLNAAQSDAVFSKAEEHELLFQDVDIGPREDHRERTAIDILSCTTTMEVGIDIGSLSGVALRNMPPARANYQQRAGRAGRRGTAVATVIAFGSADSHDEHYFSHPDQMIRGDVDDPILNVDNEDIARRHVTAFLLQRYHQDRLPAIAPEDQPHLFAVLGKVREFKTKTAVLNYWDLNDWLCENEAELRQEVLNWLPSELEQGARDNILAGLVNTTLETVADAIDLTANNGEKPGPTPDNVDEGSIEVKSEEGEERPAVDPGTDNLLDRLLYKAILPRYAFPTDVVTFHVFDVPQSTRYRPVFQYAPSQGLPVALSQYAPGKQVWVDNKLWTSGAIYSTMPSDRFQAWQGRRLYFECGHCHYSMTEPLNAAERGEVRQCPACGTQNAFGPARYWLRPPGFAHPFDKQEGTSPDDQPARSYATRAKLTAPTPSEEGRWHRFNDRVKTYYLRDHLLVTNRGPKDKGYNYCTKCGRIEPSAISTSAVLASHQKPFPMPRDQGCSGGGATNGIVLGTDFITDVLLMSVKVDAPISLRPGLLSTDVALRTLCEALTSAACSLLELEASELQAEYRPALTDAGRIGQEAEIYIYDTLPGGAGFSRHVNELGDDLFRTALHLLVECPDNCDRSCYRCLRNYKNKFEHDLLDRQLGATLLRFLLDGGEPIIDHERIALTTDLLFEDLLRQGKVNLRIERAASIDISDIGRVDVPILVTKNDGSQFAIAVHSGLTPGYAPTVKLRELANSTLMPVHLEDETIVRRNLPTATKRILDTLGLD